MATSPFRTNVEPFEQTARFDAIRHRNLETIAALTDGFAHQDIDRIMAHFAEDACYFDIMGRAQHGGEAKGKPAIRSTFLRQFAVMGQHTYADSVAVADIHTGFASWTLILGAPVGTRTQRFAGIDEFWFDEHGKVTVKKAWLKGIPRLALQVVRRNPKGLAHQMVALIRGTSA
jgi:SnoaL-like domain